MTSTISISDTHSKYQWVSPQGVDEPYVNNYIPAQGPSSDMMAGVATNFEVRVATVATLLQVRVGGVSTQLEVRV